ncbi:MAG: type II toxin-antitoxin system ParD family antitoxin [Pseudomonadota bacterium]
MRTTKQGGMIPAGGKAGEANETVRPGECAREGEVMGYGRRAVENWLVRHIGPAYDALRADPSRAVTADALRARLAAEYAKAQ